MAANRENWGFSVLILGAVILVVAGILAYQTSHQIVCTLLCVIGSASCCEMRGAFLTPVAEFSLTLGVITLILSLLTRFTPKRRLGACLTVIFGILSFLSLLLGTLSYTMMYPNVQMFHQSDVIVLILSLVGMAVCAIGMAEIVEAKPDQRKKPARKR
ncbi:MAG: hypothetical protein KGH54_01550 [Candidatus Micrarchaeota archaeon]|nr:hypothetical protein [Candidatus Micrarchaeota archaeon]